MATSVLFFLAVIALFTTVSLVLRRVQHLPLNQAFDTLVKLLGGLMLFHCMMISFHTVVPVALLYGPIHFFMHRLSERKGLDKGLFLHTLPFFVMSLFYVVVFPDEHSGENLGMPLKLYYLSHFILVVLSTFAYGIYIWLADRSQHNNRDQMQLVLQLASIAIIIGIFVVFLALSDIGLLGKDVLGFNALHLVYGLLLLCVLVMSVYLVNIRQKADEGNELQQLVLEDGAFEELPLRLNKLIDDKKLYLNANLTLDDLAAESGIPRHRLSQLLNVYFRTTFYNYLAERRIREALARMKEDKHVTIESLAYDCGFNSKSSFNRHFKDIVGITPSEYRATSQER